MAAIKREERIGGQRLILGDCLEVMPTLGQFDAVITSPPYDNLRDYGPGFEGVDCLAVISAVSELLIEGGVCMWNVADATIDGSETGSSFRQALHAMECGLNLHDTMIYLQEGVAYPESNRYHNSHEYMFVFSKGKPKTFNPIKDCRNKYAGKKITGTERQKDGSFRNKSGIGKELKPFGMRYNWWIMTNNNKTSNHPAPMPYQMANDHIVSWSNAGDTVLDPFMGSGTTLIACQKLGRQGTGIELDPDYFEDACKRVEEASRQLDLFVEETNPATQEALGL